jgi:hypothetical protein
MKKINYLLLFIFVFMMSVLSCKKDESTPANVLSTQERNREMIIGVSWKISSHKAYGASVMQDCEKDDIYTFNADGSYSLNVGSLICNGETNASGSWIIYPDGTVTLSSGNMTMGMVVANSQQLVVSQYDARYDEMSYQLTLIPN